MVSLVLHPQVEVFALSASSQTETSQLDITDLLVQDDLFFSYDEVLDWFEELESGELEKKYNPSEVDRIIRLLIFFARAGELPSEHNDGFDLEADLQEFFSEEEKSYRYSYDFYNEGEYEITSAVCYQTTDIVFCKGGVFKKIGRGIKKAGKALKHHKKEVIIGLVVVAAVAVVAVVAAAVIAGTTASAMAVEAAATAGAAAATAASSGGSDHREKQAINSSGPSLESISNEGSTGTPFVLPNFSEERSALKEIIIEERFLQSNNSGLSERENGRILGQVFAHQSLDNLTPYGQFDPTPYGGIQKSEILSDLISDKHEMIDRAFSSDSTQTVSAANLGTDFKESVYQLRGERAFELKHYDQAVFDFGKAIELNPNNHEAYLDRATAYLEMGEYENCLADYQQYTAQKSIPIRSNLDFSIAFAKALPRGVKDSAYQLGSFAYDAVLHPIDTGAEVIHAFATLSTLVYSQEWTTIAETLSPEVYELVTKWDTLSSKEQGDLAGYAFGKYGSDILIPGTSVKLFSSGVKGAKELAAACKALKTVEKTLVLESVAQSSSQIITEAIPSLRTTEYSVAASKEVAAVSSVEVVLSDSARLESLSLKESLGWVLPEKGGAKINGRWYTEHALERMAPRGLIQSGTEMVSRGVPTSVVENAIEFGAKTLGNTEREIVHTFENVRVVTSLDATRIITVIIIGK